MNHITGQIVVTDEDGILEIVGQQVGAGGALSAQIRPGVTIDIDAANIDSMTSVRIQHSGKLSVEHEEAIQELFGETGESIATACGSSKPVRINIDQYATGRRSFRRESTVSEELAKYVSATDSLNRFETPISVKPLLELEIAIVAATSRVFTTNTFSFSQEYLEESILTCPRKAHSTIRRLLSVGTDLGLIDDITYRNLIRLTEVTTQTVDSLISEIDYYGENVLKSVQTADVSSFARGIPGVSEVNAPALIGVDNSSILAGQVLVYWETPTNINVTIERGTLHASTTLWARARRDSDHSIVAISPMVAQNLDLTTMLLVSNTDHYIVDVTDEVSARVVSPHVGSLNRAYEAGRKAGRLERLGYYREAAAAWRECAQWHTQSGDTLRWKLATVMPSSPREHPYVTLSDHIAN